MAIKDFIINDVQADRKKESFFEIPANPLSAVGGNYNIPTLGEVQEAFGVGQFGTPVFSVVFILPEIFQSGGRIFTVPPVLLDTVLIDVQKRKMILETPVQGRTGTVKEYISDMDYNIRIRGVIVNDNANQYPFLQVGLLNQALDAPTALKVVSPTLQQFGIFNIVVTDVNFPMSEGQLNVQRFEIRALSEQPAELEVKNRALDRRNLPF